MKDFSSIVAPLTEVIKKNIGFRWGEEQEIGHFGVAKTLAVLQEHFYWPHMKEKLREFVVDVSHVGKLNLECSPLVCILFYQILVSPGLIFQWTL